MNNKFSDFRKKYKKIVYEKYIIEEDNDNIVINFIFTIPSLTTFKPKITIAKKNIIQKDYNKDIFNNIVFNIGLVELISYYKSVCPKIIEINCGYINKEQEEFYKKLYYNGLGEFFYRNNIEISSEDLFEFKINRKETNIPTINYQGIGNLIPVGGGKDSVVTLELLKKYNTNNSCFIINPKKPSIECANIAGYQEIVGVKREIDKEIIRLNQEGFLNGHTPFSAIVAFTSFLSAYLLNKKYIVLSNENSANEPTVLNTNINHQYSKSIEFENDFRNYSKNYLKVDIEYFSLLRPIKELQIAKLFSQEEKYFKVFKSCNLGSKESNWNWCGNCPKCLFVFIILSAFLEREKVIKIFNKDLLNDKNLEKDFIELIGKSETKPFECVGTIDEVIYSLNLYIEKNKDLPYLVELYKNNYYENINIDLKALSKEHNVPEEYIKLLKEAI